MNRELRPIVTDMLLGAVAGAVASWFMAQTTGYLDKHQSKRVKEQEKEANRGKRTSGAETGNALGMVEQGGVSGLSSGGKVAVEKAARMAGQELADEERKRLEVALNLVLSMGAGAAYALLRYRVPGADFGHGLVFGIAFWLLIDEIGNPVLGLTPPPADFHWQTDIRGLVGHMVFGVVTEAVFQLTDELS